MIEQIHQQTGHGIRPICQVLAVPRSSYYHASNPTPSQAADIEHGDLIEAIFKRHRRCYGYRRIHSDLSDRGIVCAAARVRRIMEERWGERPPFNRISIKLVSVDAIQQYFCFRVTEETDAGGHEMPTAHLRNGLGSRRTAGNCVLIPTPG